VRTGHIGHGSDREGRTADLAHSCPFGRLLPHERQEDARVASLLGNHNCGSVRHLRKVLITQLDELLLLRLPGYGYLLTSPDVGQVVIGRKTETSPSWMITS